MLLNPVKGVPRASDDWFLGHSRGRLKLALENEEEGRTRTEIFIGQRLQTQPQLIDFSLNPRLERYTEVVVTPRLAYSRLIDERLLGFDREEVGDVNILLQNQQAVGMEKGRIPTFGNQWA